MPRRVQIARTYSSVSLLAQFSITVPSLAT
jgi:hypothetical protein